MEYGVLLEKYENLLEENKKLSDENKKLKEQLNLDCCIYNNQHKEVPPIDKSKNTKIDKTTENTFNNYSSPKEKIKLFISMFKGRPDVYAKRWQNKEGKSGYSPVCLNEWRKGVCNKPQIKCSECNNKNNALLDEFAIEKHLKGKDVLGIYPMLEDESCYFLAIDFDDSGWQNDVSTIIEICNEKNIPASVERSRSGNGAHIWFFFEGKISATIARKFGTAILTYAMMKRHEIKFKSYDRLFPNQDTMPKGGFGNLIALPLQLYARKNNNSSFIDNNFNPYDDQWEYLSSIRKLKECEVKLIISELCSDSELGELRTADDQMSKPWQTNTVKVEINKSDFPNTIYVIKANMLYIKKKGFSSKSLLGEFLQINEILPKEETNKRGRKKKFSIIGQIGAGKNNPSGIIDIAIMQSVVTGDEVKDLIREYGMVIVDECHHVPAFSFEQIMKNINAKYVYGLTATPIRKDGHHPIIFMHCGPIRYKVDPLKQAKKRPFEHYIIPRFTSYRRFYIENEQSWTIGEIYSDICKNDIRNQFIIEDVLEALRQGRNPIILTERTSHVEILAQNLKEKLVNVVTLTGKMSSKQRKSELEKLNNMHVENNTVIVATGRFVGEGFDMPRLDTLFLAMPIAWKGTISQYAGRLHRLYESKSEVQIYDYIDIHINVLEKMYQKRLKGYAAIGYSIKSDSKSFSDFNSIFNNDNFLTAFTEDILAAKLDITIVSPYINEKGLDKILIDLNGVIKNGVKLTVVTRPETDYKEKDKFKINCRINDIKKIGGNVVLRSNIHQKFAVIDQRIVWYGSINLLSSSNSDGSIIRLDNVNIADELLCSFEELN